MKITEITEAPGDFGKFTRFVGGAAKRQAADIGRGAMAKMGFNRAGGAQQMQRIVGGVVNNFNRYLGQTGGKPTVAALKQYLTALGIQEPAMERRGIMPQKAQNLRNKLKTMPKPLKPQAQQPAQAPVYGGRKDTDVLSRNDLFDIIGKNIQQAMASGTLPKELQKFLK